MKQTRSFFFLFFILIIPQIFVTNASGYSYGKRGNDTIVTTYKNIEQFIKLKKFDYIEKEIKNITVPIKNYSQYFGIDLGKDLEIALKKKNFNSITLILEQLIFLGIKEKITWNNKEALKNYIAAKARMNVIHQYYMVLQPQILIYDRSHRTKYNKKIIFFLIGMNKSLGNPGIFGYKSVKPNILNFNKLSTKFQGLLAKLFPHFEKGYSAIFRGK